MSCTRSLALGICPRAPFLIPWRAFLHLTERRQNACVHPQRRLATQATQQKSSKFLTRIKNERKLQEKEMQKSIPKHLVPREIQLEFSRVIAEKDLRDVMRIYPKMLENRFLQHSDTREIAQLLHNTLRVMSVKGRVKAHAGFVLELVAYADRLVQDVKEGLLVPSPMGHLHLIRFYHDAGQSDKAYELWKWLQTKGETYVNPRVYGAAIEVMAYSGRASLEELEGTYEEALQRFPGSFAGYHLSASAIVPDRGQLIDINGLSMTLLQGIITARLLLGGNSKMAYLGLDTAMRLFPTQVPSRVLEVFVAERPVNEAFTVFMMACRSGVLLSPSTVNRFMNKLVKYLTTQEQPDRVTVLNRVIDAIEAYNGTGGKVSGVHTNILAQAIGGLFPGEKLVYSREASPQVTEEMILVTRELMSSFENVDMPLKEALTTGLISLAGKSRQPEFLSKMMLEQEQKLTGTQDDHRVILDALGRCGDKEGVRKQWEKIIELSQKIGNHVQMMDWVTFAKAGVRTDSVDYVGSQMEELEHTLTDRTVQRVDEILDKQTSRTIHIVEVDLPAFKSEIAAIITRIRALAHSIKHHQRHDFLSSPFPETIFLQTPHTHTLPADLRAVYDSLTTDPYRPDPSAADPSLRHTSPTGMPFDELRFRNWRSLTVLLADAADYDARRRAAIDAAVTKGTPVAAQLRRLEVRRGSAFAAAAEAAIADGAEGVAEPDSGERRRLLREYVVQLRSPDEDADAAIALESADTASPGQ